MYLCPAAAPSLRLCGFDGFRWAVLASLNFEFSGFNMYAKDFLAMSDS